MKKIIPIVLISLLAFGCSEQKSNLAEIENLQIVNDSLQSILAHHEAPRKNQIHTFLTFQDNNAEKAMNFYLDLFDNSKITEVKRWGKEGPVAEGKIMHATFELNGSMFMCSDSPPMHEWGFTPAVSNFIQCDTEAEQDRLFAAFSEKGNVLMPLNDYGFSKKFGWVEDQFGISWQLNLD